LGVFANSFCQQSYCFIGLASSRGHSLREENRTRLISHDQVWIKIRGDIQQGSLKIVARGAFVEARAEILHRSRPIYVGQQRGVAKAHPLEDFPGREV